MGAASSSMLTDSSVLEVNASVQTLWETAMEVETSPDYIEDLLQAEIVGDDKEVKQGSVIREVRMFAGKPIELLYTVTDLQPLKSISTSVQRSDAVGGKGAARVGTWTFVPVADDDTKCQFVCTWAASLDSLWMRLAVVCCHSCMMYRIVQSFRKNMENIAAEAERRQLQKDATNKADEDEHAVVVTLNKEAGEKDDALATANDRIDRLRAELRDAELEKDQLLLSVSPQAIK